MNMHTKGTDGHFAALFEESPDILLVHTDAGEITEVNATACAELGYTEEELCAMTVWDIDPAADRHRSADFWDSIDSRESKMFETQHQRKDGSTFPVEVHLIRMPDAASEFLAITRNITERKRRERQLEQHHARLETFMDALAHDIPNHLSVATGYLELADDTGDSSYLEHVRNSHERIETLVTDMRSLLRLGTELTDEEPIRLSEIIPGCWQMCCGTDGVETYDILTDGVIKADRSRLRQLLENLFWNACDHAGQDVTVRIEVLDHGFAVEDNGPGIPPGKREAVLKPGYTTGGEDHTGYGLATVSEIAHAHDWEITITDGADGGARFVFTGVTVLARDDSTDDVR